MFIKRASEGADSSDDRVQYGISRPCHGPLSTGIQGAHAVAGLLQSNDVTLAPIGRTGLYTLSPISGFQAITDRCEAVPAG